MDTHDSPPASFVIEQIASSASDQAIHEARELLLEYGRFAVAQPGAARFCFSSLEEEAARLPHSYLDQGGGCLLAHVRDTPAGFIAWRTLPPSVAPRAWELKRLWVRPAARGLSMGRALTKAVLGRALDAGCQAVYLDTAPASMASAHRLYLDLGFEPCLPYNNNPVEGLAWLRKSL